MLGKYRIVNDSLIFLSQGLWYGPLLLTHGRLKQCVCVCFAFLMWNWNWHILKIAIFAAYILLYIVFFEVGFKGKSKSDLNITMFYCYFLVDDKITTSTNSFNRNFQLMQRNESNVFEEKHTPSPYNLDNKKKQEIYLMR